MSTSKQGRGFQIRDLTHNGKHWTARLVQDGGSFAADRKFGSWQISELDDDGKEIRRRDVLGHVALALQEKVRKIERAESRQEGSMKAKTITLELSLDYGEFDRQLRQLAERVEKTSATYRSVRIEDAQDLLTRSSELLARAQDTLSNLQQAEELRIVNLRSVFRALAQAQIRQALKLQGDASRLLYGPEPDA